MKRLRIIYNDAAKMTLRGMIPQIKPMIKKLIEDLADNPYQGKPLKDEFRGYFSARHKQWRIIYTVDETHQRLMVHLIEKRATVYDTLKSYPPILALHERRARYGRFRRAAAVAAATTP